MLQAMNTGHEGSLTTIHANSPRDALSRLETLVLTAGVELPLRAIREQISSAFDLLVQISAARRRLAPHHAHHRGARGWSPTWSRCRTSSSRSRRTRRARHGDARMRLLQPLACTGLKPHFLEKMAANGVVAAADVLRGRGRLRCADVRGCAARELRRETRAASSPLSRGVASLALGRGRAGAGVEHHAASTRAATRRARRPSSRSQSVEARPAADRERAAGRRPRRREPRPARRASCLAVDRSQSMRGRPLADASAAAGRSSPQSLPTDRIAVVELRHEAASAAPTSPPRRPTPTPRSQASGSTRPSGTAL